MTIQRRFAPISGRFEPERVAGFAGIYNQYLLPLLKVFHLKGVMHILNSLML